MRTPSPDLFIRLLSSSFCIVSSVICSRLSFISSIRSSLPVRPVYKLSRNSKKEKVKADARSKKKGPEPENVTVGSVGKENFAFVGVERSGGIAVFSLKNPEKPQMAGYFAKKEDRGPEGVLFISAENSPLPGTPLLVVCYEYGKTLVVYRIFY